MTGGIGSRPIWVVAGALRGRGQGTEGVSEDTWLMQRRPFEKDHGGLWEFPGGKIEDTEIPVKALVRELREELGITIRVDDCIPAAFAEERRPRSDADCAQTGNKNLRSPIVILLYTIDVWAGEPLSLEGGRLGWFTPKEIMELDKPPLDRELALRLFEKG